MTDSLHSVTAPAGFRVASGAFNIKPSGKPDMILLVADQPCAAAAVTTTSQMAAAPVLLTREHVAAAPDGIRGIVVNAGNANAATGAPGLDDARTMATRVAHHLGCAPTAVLVASTGVIGRRLPIKKITAGIDALHPVLATGPDADAAAARAIMTTDLVPKLALISVNLDEISDELAANSIKIGGICKGSGMIAPNMATMLAFITTDAKIAPALLRRALVDAVNADASFNRISVDCDTSTSDILTVLASGAADHEPIADVADPRFEKFAAALTELCQKLAYQVIADGEGVNHIVRYTVTGAATDADALRVARTVADSPLVKTAIHGGDPNWGRIAAAAGRAGATFDQSKLTVKIGPHAVFDAGKVGPFDEPTIAAIMQQDEVPITIDLGLGTGRCVFLGCDLSRDYITINADYTT